MSFRDDVGATKEICSCFKSGLNALARQDKIKIRCEDTTKINGSVNIDKCLINQYQHEARWDYAIGYGDRCYFVEIHPAATSDVATMLNKLNWLKKWLKNQSSPLQFNHAGFHWVASGKVKITPNSPQARKLSSSGINGPKSHCICKQ